MQLTDAADPEAVSTLSFSCTSGEAAVWQCQAAARSVQATHAALHGKSQGRKGNPALHQQIRAHCRTRKNKKKEKRKRHTGHRNRRCFFQFICNTLSAIPSLPKAMDITQKLIIPNKTGTRSCVLSYFIAKDNTKTRSHEEISNRYGSRCIVVYKW